MVNKKILLLATNPKDTPTLRLNEEVRQVKEALKLAGAGEQLEVESEWAVRSGDLHRYLLQHNPQIVHFLGHGAGKAGLVVEDKDGRSKLVSTATLDRLFRLCKGVECVLLNACYSLLQADAITKHVDYVIGMNREIGDAAAIRFSEGFYDGLGFGRSYAEAFEFGLLAMEEEGIPETLTPILRIRGKRQPRTATLLKSRVKGAEVEVEDANVFEEIATEASKPDMASTPRKLVVEASPDSSPDSSLDIGSDTDVKTEKSRIFISYKRNVEPDEPVALAIYEALKEQHEVFIDQTMLVGTRWAVQIETELRQADVLIVLLSDKSVGSEMVQQEVTLAYSIAEEQGGPRIFPVRLNYQEPFRYPLSAYLNPINWAIWESEADTPALIDELNAAILGGKLPAEDQQQPSLVKDTVAPNSNSAIPKPLPSAQPRPLQLELPEGTMAVESAFYIERDSDVIAMKTAQEHGVTITIKGPRQMGKSSLLNRVMAEAAEAGKQVAFFDFLQFDRDALQNADEFYQQFCFCLTDELMLKDDVASYWQQPLGNIQRCTRYMGRHILKPLEQPLMLAMDEVERIFDAPFHSDFFSMLRSWHNQRATQPLWRNLDLALVTSTEPYQLITDLNQSPFNVGQVLLLEDFTTEQVHELNERHQNEQNQCPFTNGQLQQLTGLLSGHPYLVRRSMYLVGSGQLTASALFSQANDEHGPFGAHLRHHMFRLVRSPALIEGLLQILQQETCPDEKIYSRLHGAGLVCRDGQRTFVRNQLYANYFGEYLQK